MGEKYRYYGLRTGSRGMSPWNAWALIAVIALVGLAFLLGGFVACAMGIAGLDRLPHETGHAVAVVVEKGRCGKYGPPSVGHFTVDHVEYAAVTGCGASVGSRFAVKYNPLDPYQNNDSAMRAVIQITGGVAIWVAMIVMVIRRCRESKRRR